MSAEETRRKSRPKEAIGSPDAPLFADSMATDSGTQQVVVLSSNFSIGPLLARGCLLPGVLEGEAAMDTDRPWTLQWSIEPFPSSWVDALVASARNVIPIAVRLSLGRKV